MYIYVERTRRKVDIVMNGLSFLLVIHFSLKTESCEMLETVFP